MKPFEEILLMPASATVLGAKLSGRLIGRVAAGFGDDPALGDMMNLFRTLENKWPGRILSLRDMFDIQLKQANKERVTDETVLETLTPEQREIWLKEPAKQSPSEKLIAALPKIVDLYDAATPEPDSWEDLTPINQWSLLNATERGLLDRIKRYKAWAKDDEDKGKTETNAIVLRDEALEEIEPLGEVITHFLADPYIADALQEDLNNGVRVPVRIAS